jgi:hypothetical protein
MSHEHHKLSQEVLEFLIKHQDWFMLDIPPPPRSDSLVNPSGTEKATGGTPKSRNPFLSSRIEKSGSSSKANDVIASSSAAAAALTDDLNMYVGPVSDDEEDGGWRLAGSVTGSALGRRRTFSERGSPRLLSDEHARTAADGRRSAENVASSSSSAPINATSPIKSAKQLTPVREVSMADMDALFAEPHSMEGSASTGPIPPASTEQTAAAAAAASATAGAGAGSRTATNRQGTAASSVEGGDTSSVPEKRAKFDDEKLAKNEEARRDAEKERRGRSGTKGGGLWGSVRRARTVEGTKTPSERHTLKKRNSRSDVEKVVAAEP